MTESSTPTDDQTAAQADPDPSTDQAGAAQPDAPPAEPEAPAAYHPENLAEDLRGETDQATIDKLIAARDSEAKRAEGLRKKLGLNTVPKDAAEYGDPTLSPDFAEKGLYKADDPVMDAARTAAQKVGMPVEMFQVFVGEVYEKGLDGALAEPVDLAAEAEAVGGQAAFDEARSSLGTQIEALAAKGRVSEAEKQELENLTVTAAGQSALAKLLGNQASPGVVTGGTGEAAQSNRERAREMMKDARYDSSSPQFDAKFVADVRALFNS